jgi:hypothetical protein
MLKTAEQLNAQGHTVKDACRDQQASLPNPYRDITYKGGMKAEEAKRVKDQG